MGRPLRTTLKDNPDVNEMLKVKASNIQILISHSFPISKVDFEMELYNNKKSIINCKTSFADNPYATYNSICTLF